MSLLLDALKRAEEAKKAAQGAADAPAATGDEPLSLAPLHEPRHEDAAPRLMTRDALPNISQAVVTLDEDPPPPGSAGMATPGRPPAGGRIRGSGATAATDAQRHAAQQLFEAKAPAYDPRRPFYFVLGALGLLAIGIVAYFWYQLQPRTPVAPIVVQRTPAPPASAAPENVPIVPPSTAPAAPIDSGATYAAAQPAAPTPPASVTDTADRAAEKSVPAARESQRAVAQPANRPARPSANDPLALRRAAPQGPSPVELGYAAFERGEIDAARGHYQAALNRDPLNRDALLGLAAIDIRTQQYASAEARYLKLLERDPRDAYAHAGLIGLRGRGDPVATESRIKNLLAKQPESNVLQFTLGNQYAGQGRWPEAQQAYFKAYAADPANADYAFNLAVSLDHLRQPRLAAEYYRKAIALSGARPAAFDPAQAETRLRQLEP